MSDAQAREVKTPGTTGLIFEEPVIFEMGSPGRKAYSLPSCDVPEVDRKSVV